MIQRRRWMAALTAAAVAAGVMVAHPAAAELTGANEVTEDKTPATTKTATKATTAGGSAVKGTVTLLTGDRVTYHSVPGKAPRVGIHPGAGRQAITFRTLGVGDQLEVIPSDAAQLVAAGKLDRRLFAIPRLLADGFGDTASKTMPLIVQRTDRSAVAGASVSRQLPSLDAAALEVRKPEAARAWSELTRSRGLRKIWLDGKVRPTLDVSVPQIGAPAAWQAGYTGDNVKVAVLDTGIDHSHRDLKAVEAKDFTGTRPDAQDDQGHGTHVAGIIAGSGAASGGKYRGVAPDVDLLVGKVLDAGGTGDESMLIAGMEWAAGAARVVNLSIGSAPTDGTDPLSTAVDKLSHEHGTVFVVAAGNSGPGQRTVDAPGAATSALTVGSVTKEGAMSDFSGRGPRVGDSAAKPDVVAPGSAIVSARAKDTPGTGDYTQLSGTSMATPHVAGLAALLAQQHSDWNGSQLKAAIRSSTKPVPGANVADQGTGLVDAERAIKQDVVAETAADFGLVRWPHDQQLTRTVTYRNAGATPVELTLGAEIDAPAGLVSPAADKVVVPARGTASVEVTLRPDRSTAPGYHAGWLVGTDPAGRSVRTLLAVDIEPESYDLTVRALDRDGTAVRPYVSLLDTTTEEYPLIQGRVEGDAMVYRVRRGPHWLGGTVLTGTKSETYVTMPHLDLRSDRTVVLDARSGRRMSFQTVDSPSARTRVRHLALAQDLPSGRVLASSWALGDAPEFFAAPSKPVTDRPFLFTMTEGKVTTTATYNLAFNEAGRIPAQLTRQVRDLELGRVQDRYHGQGASPVHARRYSGFYHPQLSAELLINTEVAPPAQRLQLYSDVPGAVWTTAFQVVGETWAEGEYEAVGRRIRPGTSHRQAFNAGPVRTRAIAAQDDRGILAEVNGAVSASLAIPVFDRETLPFFDQAELTLVRNHGELTKKVGYLGAVNFRVPPGRAHYSLRGVGSRNAAHTKLATKVDTTWTFETAEQPDPSAPLPLISVRATADVDDDSTVPAGRPHRLKVVVEGADVPQVDGSELRMRASFDDGANWQDLTLTRTGKGWTTTVNPPPGAGFVSLHSIAKTPDGSTVDQTVIRSYGLREVP